MGSEVKKMRHDNLVIMYIEQYTTALLIDSVNINGGTKFPPPPPASPVARLQMAVKTQHPFLQGQAHQKLDYVFKSTVQN
jgi:hypothetical protein